MINYIRGILTEKHPPTLVIETNNAIGYAIEASMQTFYQLPPVGQNILLYTTLLNKDEKQSLYGFMQSEERQLFQELIKINTIGPKVALAILSNMDTLQLTQVVTYQDTSALQHIPGIGKKTAERLLLELKNRIPLLATHSVDTQMHQASSEEPTNQYLAKKDAISALIALGYKPQIASQTVHNIATSELSTEKLIRLALSHLT